MPLTKWEYFTMFIGDAVLRSTDSLLTECGDEGWEFTGHVTDNGYGKSYLMKRNQEWRQRDDDSD